MSDTARRRWRIEVEREGSQFRWKLINRDGDLVMTSRTRYVTYGGAEIAARHEKDELRRTEVVS